MPATGEMPECERQAGRQEVVRQLLHALDSAAPVQAEGAGLQEGSEGSADLVRGHLFHPKEVPQFNVRLTTRLRGSGRPLPPLSDRFELKKDDKMYGMTPIGVFFTAIFPLQVNEQALCQQPQSVPRQPPWPLGA